MIHTHLQQTEVPPFIQTWFREWSKFPMAVQRLETRGIPYNTLLFYFNSRFLKEI